MQRPIGFTVFALILGWLALAGLANAALAAFEPAPLLRLGLAPAVLVITALAYAATAAWAAVGLWRIALWSSRAVTAWAIAFDVLVLAFVLAAAPAGLLPPIPTILLGIGLVTFLVLPWLLVAYVRRGLVRTRGER